MSCESNVIINLVLEYCGPKLCYCCTPLYVCCYEYASNTSNTFNNTSNKLFMTRLIKQIFYWDQVILDLYCYDHRGIWHSRVNIKFALHKFLALFTNPQPLSDDIKKNQALIILSFWKYLNDTHKECGLMNMLAFIQECTLSVERPPNFRVDLLWLAFLICCLLETPDEMHWDIMTTTKRNETKSDTNNQCLLLQEFTQLYSKATDNNFDLLVPFFFQNIEECQEIFKWILMKPPEFSSATRIEEMRICLDLFGRNDSMIPSYLFFYFRVLSKSLPNLTISKIDTIRSKIIQLYHTQCLSIE